MKMYIAVLTEFPDYMVPTLIAHSVLSAHIEFNQKEPYKEWFEHSFRKVVLRVNQKEFDKISSLTDVHLTHELKTLDARKACAVVCPREEYHNVLKYAKLWKPIQPLILTKI